MVKNEKREKAEEMRAQGKSYGEISKELGVAKSTLSYWFSKTSGFDVTSDKQKEHLKKARAFAHIAIKKRCNKRDTDLKERITVDFSKISIIDSFTKKVALSMLYWAEGSKGKRGGGPNFANTDPMLISAYVSLLEQSFEIDRSKIKIRLHIHSYHNENKCKEFWSSLIGINMNQFNKTFVKPRGITKKFRENFMGICFVYYPNSDIRREILEIGRQFCGLVSLSSFNGQDESLRRI